MVTCPTCDGKGRCNHWLEVVEEPLTREVALGDERLRSASAVERSEATLPFGGMVSSEEASLLAQPRFAQHWASGERAATIGIHRYRGVVHRIGYELAGRSGVVSVQGWDAAIEGTPALGPISRWRRLRWLAAAAGVFVGIVLLALHAGRGAFYVRSLQTLGLVVAVVALLLEGRRIFSAFSVKRLRARAAKRRIGEVGVVVIAAVLLLASRRPSLAHAMEREISGRMAEAIREYEALARTSDAAAAAARLDHLQVVELGKLPAAQIWPAARASHFLTAEGSAEARSLAEQRTLAAIRDEVAAGSFAGARTLLDQLDAAAPVPFLAQASALVDEAEATSLWHTVESDDDGARRLAACEGLARLAGVKPVRRRGEVAVTSEDIRRTCDAIRRTEDARRARLQREEEARLARERREAERQAPLERAAAERADRAREGALRAWASAPLRCRDGTLSPSCVCGSSSHRGCCSWHRGVSGCSRDYPSN
jgi:hypothetical protein